jgi:hypothetical protein
MQRAALRGPHPEPTRQTGQPGGMPPLSPVRARASAASERSEFTLEARTGRGAQRRRTASRRRGYNGGSPSGSALLATECERRNESEPEPSRRLSDIRGGNMPEHLHGALRGRAPLE